MARKSDIRLRRSAISGSVPGGADLNLGELALNTADGAIFVKNGGGDIVTVSHDGILHYDEANSRIGIGTTIPSSTFQVEGTGDYLANFKSSDATSGIKLTDSSSQSRVVNIAGNLVLLADANNNSSNSTIRFNIDTASLGASDASMVLTSTGLGIGTSTPAFKLSVDSGTSDFPAYFKSTDNKAAIVIADDTTTVYVSAENSIASLGMQAGLHTNNLNVMNTGYVGIGTSSPARRLTVQGSSGDNLPARFIGGANTTHGSIEFQDPTTTADYKVVIGSKTDDLYFQSGGNEKARLTSGGFLGIGTGSTADTPIHVYRASGISGIIPQLKLHANTSDNTGTQGSSIDFVASSDKTAIGSRIIAARVAAGAHQNLKFHTARDTFAMIIDENQNVGIGVAAPGAKLQVDGAIVSEGGSFASAQEGSMTDVGLVVPKNNYIYSDDGTYLRRIIGTTTAGLIEIGQGGTALITDIILKPGSTGNVRFFASGSEDVRINASGNVGIGTTSPSSKLVVSDSDGAGLEFIPQTSNDRTTLLSYDRNSSTYQTIDFDGSDVHFNIAGSEKARFDTLGRLLVTDNGYNAQFGNNIGGNSDKFVAVSSATAGQTVAYHLGVNDTARNSRVKLFMTDDAATANRAFGIAQTWSSGGAMPFILTMGNNERLKLDTTGTVTFNNAYTFPASIGAAGQILKVPATGTDLIWGADAGGGSATLLTDSDGDTLIQVEESTDDDIIRFDTAGQQRMTILSNGKVGIGNTATTILHVEDDNANSFGTTTAWEVQTSDSLALVNASNSDGDQITSFYMRASGNGGNVSARQILRNTSSGAGEIHWQMRDSAHTTTTNDKMILKSSGQLGIGISPSGAKLHIQDDSGVQLRVQSSVSTGDFYKSGNDLVIANNANGVVKFWNNSVERIRLDGSGHVRIGGAAAANASGSRQTLHIDSVTNGAAIRLSQNDSGALFRYDTTNGLKIGTITNEILTLQTNDTDAVQINTAQDVTIFGNELNIQGASPYIRGTGTGAMRIKHTAGQTMHIRPDENGPISFYEGSSGNQVYLMTASPTTNSSTNDSSYLSFQTRSKKADGTSQSATASIRARTLNVSNNQSELLFTGMSQHRFANDVVVEGNLTVNGTQTILNTATLSVDDLNITVADGAADAAAANGAGLTVDGADATWTYSSGDDAWASNKHAQFYTGGGTGTLSVGRTSNQAIRLYADDNYNRIFAYQDSDTNGDHYFDLVRDFQGTGKADMRFMSGTAVHAVLDKAGNFGINTVAPSNKLEVNGIASIYSGLRLGSSSSGEGIIRYLGGTANGIGITTGSLTSPYIKLYVAHANDGGGVGIGTTAPSDKLHVIGNTKIEQTSNVDAILRLNPNSGTIGSNYRWELTGRNSAENYNFQIREGATPYLTINNSIGGGAGNVGIGTTNPTSHINTGSFFKPDSNGKFLTLNGGANGSFIMLESSTTTDNDQIGGIYWNRTQGQGDAHKQVAGIDVIQAAYGPNNILEGGTLRFFTKGSGSGVNTSRMVITHDGNVGIGTTAPTDPLVVQSSGASMGGGSTLTNSYFTITDGTTSMFHDPNELFSNINGSFHIGATHSNGLLRFQTGGTSTRMIILANGNVGIGTTAPERALHVKDATLVVQKIESTNIGVLVDIQHAGTQASNAGAYAGLRFNDNVGHKMSLSHITESSGSGYVQIGTNWAVGGEVLSVHGQGNVGIGTNSPNARLEVKSDGSSATGAEIRLQHANNNTTDVVSTVNFANNAGSIAMIQAGTALANNTGYINFFTDISGTSAERMRIHTNGNVGIGTAAPDAKLQVEYNGGHISGNVSIANSSLDLYNPLAANTDEKGSILTFSDKYQDANGYPRTVRAAIKGGTDTVGNTADGFLAFYTDSGGANSASERMRITSTGNVGIGTNSPAFKLSVEGPAQVKDYLRITNTGGSQKLLMGNQDSSGVNNPAMIMAANGNLHLGGGTSWSTSGGTFTGYLTVNDNGKVGIGDSPSNPQSTLHVSSPAGDGSGIRVSRTGSSGYLQIYPAYSGIPTLMSNNAGLHLGYNSSTAGIRIHTGNKVGVNQVAPKASFQVEEYGIDTTTSSTTATTQVAIHTFPIADFRSARFTIQITNSTDSTYHSTEILAIHDGTTANITEFGEVHTGSSVEATFDADVSSGNFRLLATPASTNSMSFKVVCHSLTV